MSYNLLKILFVRRGLKYLFLIGKERMFKEHRCVTNNGTFCKSNQALTCSFFASEENDDKSWTLETVTDTILSPGLHKAYNECNDATITNERCTLNCSDSDNWQQYKVDSIKLSTCENAFVSIE